MAEDIRLKINLEGTQAQRVLDQLERSAAFDRLKASATSFGIAATASFAAIGAASVAVVGKLNDIVNTVAGYKDLSERIGDTASAVASLKGVSDSSGVALDTIASASIKLTAALSKQNEESAGAAATIKALGLDFQAFKQLSPVTQIETLADRFSGFSDDATKTAAAVSLFGKSGAELIPLLNDLADRGARQIGLTDQQIDQADEYSKRLDIQKGRISSLAQQYAVSLVPALSRIQQLQEELLQPDNIARAQTLADALITVAETVSRIALGLAGVTTFIGESVGAAVAGPAGDVVRLEIRIDELQEKLAALNRQQQGSRPGSAFFEQNAAQIAKATTELERYQTTLKALRSLTPLTPATAPAPNAPDKPPKPRPTINLPDPAALAAADKARNDALAEQKRRTDALTASTAALAREQLGRATGLVEGVLTPAEQFKRQVAELNTLVRDGALDKAAARVGLAVEELQNRILQGFANALAQGGSQAAADAAANQQALEDRARALQRQLADVGQGPVARRFSAGRNEIDDEVLARRAQLESQRIAGQVDPGQYQAQLDAISAFQGQALSQWDSYFAQLEARNADFGLQFNDVLLTYIDGLRNVGAELGTTLTGAFESATSAAANLGAETLLWGNGGAEAAKAIARSLLTEVVAGFIKAGIQASTFYALQQAGIVATTATSTAAAATTAATATATNATIAATAAPAAALTSLASFGSNAIPAAIGIALVSGAIGALLGNKFASGGYVDGPGTATSDSIPALLSNGEYVIRADAVNRVGRSLLDNINNGSVSRFARGGAVGTALMGSGRSQPAKVNLSITNTGTPARVQSASVREEADGSLTLEAVLESIEADLDDNVGRISRQVDRRIGRKPEGSIG
ncbi:MAG: hypothetical protein NTZ11_18420 [Gammaproteobacteria bacterium]|nr:hypothetical protein [Gammaproteobacteria bacterium]